MRKILRIKEAAKYFKMSYSTFVVKISRGEFAKFRTKDYFMCYRNGIRYKRIMNCLIIDDEFIKRFAKFLPMKGLKNAYI